MEAIVEHLRANLTAYVLTGVCLLPIVIIFRRYVVGVCQWFAEIAAYLAALHVLMWALVNLGKWFKDSTSMDRLADGTKPPPPPWEVPLKEFWDYTQYDPAWVFYFELAVTLLIIYLVFRYRPLRVQKPKDKLAPSGKKAPARPFMAPKKKGFGG